MADQLPPPLPGGRRPGSSRLTPEQIARAKAARARAGNTGGRTDAPRTSSRTGAPSPTRPGARPAAATGGRRPKRHPAKTARQWTAALSAAAFIAIAGRLALPGIQQAANNSTGSTSGTTATSDNNQTVVSGDDGQWSATGGESDDGGSGYTTRTYTPPVQSYTPQANTQSHGS